LFHLANIPVVFGVFDDVTPASTHAALNNDIPAIAQRVLQFSWAIYSFGGGHFLSTISLRGIPFRVALACDIYEFGRALFKEFLHCPHVFGSGNDLLHHIRSSGDSSQIHGYLIHSPRFKDSNTTLTFRQVQTTIIAQLRCLHDLQVFVAIIIPDHDGRCIKSFTRQVKISGWCTSAFNDVFFPNHGDTVSGRCNIIIGVHSSCSSTVDPIDLKPSPPIPPQRLCLFLWEPFN
jgi:hypothetical protein